MTVAGAYDDAAAAWASGPAAVYARLGAAMLDHSPVRLTGEAVLDVGAGTAVVADEARRRGARRAVACDVAPGMLRLRPTGVLAVLGDAARLPFPDRGFGLVAAGFCLSHLADPSAALREWRRVGAALVASAFAPGPPHPAKAAVDDALGALGFVPPAWYVALKDASQRIEDPGELRGLVAAAGYATVRVHEVQVDAGLETAEAVARWRLGMAHLAPWVAALPEARRREVVAAARSAVTGLAPVRIGMLVVTAR